MRYEAGMELPVGRIMGKRFFAPVAVALAAAGACADHPTSSSTDTTSAGATANFRASILPSPGDSATAVAMNSHGVVVGWFAGTDHRRHAVLWSNGGFTELPAPDTSGYYATSVNEIGEIAGSELVHTGSSTLCERPVTWDAAAHRPSIVTPNCAGRPSINNGGDILLPSDHSLILANGARVALSDGADARSNYVAFNDSLELVGSACTVNSSGILVLTCTPSYTHLARSGAPASRGSSASAPAGTTATPGATAFASSANEFLRITNRGDILGVISSNNVVDHYYLVRRERGDTIAIVLPLAPFTPILAVGLASSDAVVFTVPDGVGFAGPDFLWTPTIARPIAIVNITVAGMTSVAMNDAGEILAQLRLANGSRVYAVLTPAS
jgi:probable HAF family extracellular repeat protein